MIAATLEIIRAAPIEGVIKLGVVPRFVQFLTREDLSQLQFEAAWALTNIASGTSRNTKFEAAWALTNIASSTSENTKVVIDHVIVPTFVKLFASGSDDVREGKPQPSFDQTKPALPTLARIIHSNDEKVLTDACWALSYLSDDTNDKIQAVIEAGVCPWLVELLMY
ncbi:Importin subunit alpha-6, partial [Zea mays]